MQSEWYLWQTIIPLGLGTLLIRCSFLFFGNRIKISPLIRELFTYIPAAVLPALTLPMVYFHEGIVSSLYGQERLVAFIVGVIVCIISRNILVTITFGLLALYFLRTMV